MTIWRRVSGDTIAMHVPIGLKLVDDFTGRPPQGGIRLTLDAEDGPGWQETDRQPVRTHGGLYAYPGLGRMVDPIAIPIRRYRVRIAAELYVPAYRETSDGIECLVPSYNDRNPPTSTPLMPLTVVLMPAAAYPFPSSAPVLRGIVRDGAGAAVADARVTVSNINRVLTDERGAFSAPLTRQTLVGQIQLDAEHVRTGMTGMAQLILPGALNRNVEIVVN
jgi:hypothetical protein